VDDSDLDGLLARARSGDSKAADELVRRFEPDVRMVVRGRLPRALRTQFDSMDFVQAVWTSVLTTKDSADLPQFESSRHLLAYLSGMARNKVIEEHRRRTQTLKYDIGRVEPLWVRKGDREGPREVAGRDPTPSQDAQARDRLDQMLDGRSDLSAKVIQLRRGGLTYEEIATTLGIHESTARRVIERTRERVEARRSR
jgi:RNA polymerase sigma factor (sigma-70 family)